MAFRYHVSHVQRLFRRQNWISIPVRPVFGVSNFHKQHPHNCFLGEYKFTTWLCTSADERCEMSCWITLMLALLGFSVRDYRLMLGFHVSLESEVPVKRKQSIGAGWGSSCNSRSGSPLMLAAQSASVLPLNWLAQSHLVENDFLILPTVKLSSRLGEKSLWRQ